MRVTLDLRYAPGPAAADAGERLTLDDLVPVVRAPRRLVALLWGARREVVRAIVDDRPPSGVQAGALVLACLVRAPRLELETPAGVRVLGRARFLTRALVAAAVAVPRELIGSARTVRRARSFLSSPTALPRSTANAGSVAYLRPAPTLAYHGRYVGGAAAHTSGVINGLRRNGLAVQVYAAEQPERTDPGGVTQVPLRRAYHFAHWLTVTAFSEDVVRAADGHEVEFVYQRYVLGSYAGLDLARRLKVPLVLEFNGSEIWSIRNWGTGRLPLLGTLTEIEERNLRDASLVVVVSEVLREQLLERGLDADRVLVNPNGVDVEELAPYREAQPAELRSRLDLPDVPTVGFVGTFGLWHGVKLLPAIIEAVRRERPDACWVLIGDGRQHAEVRDEIERRGLADRVVITGVVPHEEALSLLAASDVCVSPHVPNPDGSRFFGSPTKLFEYMGLGRAIVASDLEQIGEVLDAERTALLHRPGDVQAAARAVVRLLGDEALRRRLGAAALEEAAAEYSWEAHVRRILDALAAGVADSVSTRA